MFKAKIYEGDMLKVTKKLKNKGRLYDACITDAPYHIESIVSRFGSSKSKVHTRYEQFNRLTRNFVGKNWDGGDIAFKVKTWKSIYDILKPGAYLLVFAFDKNYHKLARAVEKAGFEIRRMIIWCSAQYFPKGHHIGKKYFEQTKDASFLGFYTDIKTAYEPILMARKPLEGSNLNNLKKYKTGLLNVEATKLDNGRWPTNLIIDDRSALKQVLGNKALFFYCPKPSKKERNLYAVNNHPTVKPINLMRYLIRMTTRKGAKIIDPFTGSGSTGVAAIKEGVKFVGIERDKEYVKLARKRIRAEINKQ
jgi:site-specific DNA-methyltransferase (adenine-specific)